LKGDGETFKQAFDKFIISADEITIDIIANIQYVYPHECSDSAIKKCLEQKKNNETHTIIPLDGIDVQLMAIDKAETELENVLQSVSFTQHDIEHQIASEYSQDDRAYTEVAINIALDHHIFQEELNTDVDWKKIVRPVMQDQMEEYIELEKLVKVVTKN